VEYLHVSSCGGGLAGSVIPNTSTMFYDYSSDLQVLVLTHPREQSAHASTSSTQVSSKDRQERNYLIPRAPTEEGTGM
jgi:hypothetical protein